MSVNKEIICIHYYYPPIRSGGVIRNYYFSREFAKFFSKVHVITTSNVDLMENEEMDIPDNVIIYKSKTKDFRSVTKAKNHYSESLKESFLIKIFLKLKKTLPFHFYIGEGSSQYINNAYKIANELIQENDISHIYSSFMPYADHKISSKIVAKNKSIKWIADFRDLQIEPIYKNIYFPSWNKIQEQRLLKNASLITTVSQGLANSMNYYNKTVLSIPRGVELDRRKKEKNSKFTISYTGNLFQHYRDGAFFVKTFCQFVKDKNIIDKAEFIYAGRDSKVWKKWFAEFDGLSFFFDKGFVSRDESKQIQFNSNALLLLSSSSEEHQGVLTGKLFEYLETMNPIINYINGVRDNEFETLFKDLGAGYIYYPGDDMKLYNQLNELYNKFELNEVNILSELAISNREKMSWNAQVKKMLNEC